MTDPVNTEAVTEVADTNPVVQVNAAVDNTGVATTSEAETIAATEAEATAAKLTAEQKAEAETALKEKLAAIQAKYDNTVDVKEMNFHFRKVTDEKTKIATKRPTVTIGVPVPTMEGIIGILDKGGKGLDLLLEAVQAVVVEQAREYINDNESVTIDNFPYDKLVWDTIANLPKAERRGGGIAKELWEDFEKDYIAIMPSVTGKTVEQVTLAAKVFITKFANAKTNKPVLKVLQAQLGIYTSNTTQGEAFAPCIEFLSNKLDTLINTDETNLLNAL